jgi:hypothetical protein
MAADRYSTNRNYNFVAGAGVKGLVDSPSIDHACSSEISRLVKSGISIVAMMLTRAQAAM